MICNFPSPTGLCSLGQARIVVPSLVMEFIGTIWQSAPHQRGDRVDHHPEFVFGALHFGTAYLVPLGSRSAQKDQQFLPRMLTTRFTDAIPYRMSHHVCFAIDSDALMVFPLEAQILRSSK